MNYNQTLSNFRKNARFRVKFIPIICLTRFEICDKRPITFKMPMHMYFIVWSKKLIYYCLKVPAHALTEHTLFSLASPIHGFTLGPECEQVRSRLSSPTPQDTEHGPHDDHVVQIPGSVYIELNQTCYWCIILHHNFRCQCFTFESR